MTKTILLLLLLFMLLILQNHNVKHTNIKTNFNSFVTIIIEFIFIVFSFAQLEQQQVNQKAGIMHQ